MTATAVAMLAGADSRHPDLATADPDTLVNLTAALVGVSSCLVEMLVEAGVVDTQEELFLMLLDVVAEQHP
jgi:hypothetical protein